MSRNKIHPAPEETNESIIEMPHLKWQGDDGESSASTAPTLSREPSAAAGVGVELLANTPALPINLSGHGHLDKIDHRLAHPLPGAEPLKIPDLPMTPPGGQRHLEASPQAEPKKEPSEPVDKVTELIPKRPDMEVREAAFLTHRRQPSNETGPAGPGHRRQPSSESGRSGGHSRHHSVDVPPHGRRALENVAHHHAPQRMATLSSADHPMLVNTPFDHHSSRHPNRHDTHHHHHAGDHPKPIPHPLRAVSESALHVSNRHPSVWVGRSVSESDMYRVDHHNILHPEDASISEDEKEHKSKREEHWERFEKVWAVIQFVTILWALFAHDFSHVCLSYKVDFTFEIVTVFVFVSSVVDIIIVSATEKGYFLRFFFWMEVLASLSLLADILPLFHVESSLSLNEAITNAEIAGAGRAARAASRAARFVRVVKLMRVAKQAKDQRDGKEYDPDPKLEPSKVGDHLFKATTNKFIVAVLLMVIVLPFLSPDVDYEEQIEQGLLQLAASQEFNNTDLFAKQLKLFMQQPDLVYLKVHSDVLLNMDDLIHSLRHSDLLEIAVDDGHYHAEAWFNYHSYEQLSSGLSMVNTVFIILILGVGAYFISRDADNIVITPIEKMFALVRRMAENPLQEVKVRAGEENLETEMVSTAIAKFGRLLQLGFGRAGAKLISRMIKSGEFDPTTTGDRIEAIYAWFDVRGFSHITEQLQEDIILFVNEISRVVHACAHKHGGFPNRNSGGNTLLVWHLPEDVAPEKRESAYGSVASAAINTLIDIITELRHSKRMKELTFHVKGFKLRVDFGMHVGWSIMGAVGSNEKIDTTFLSPTVIVATQLEELAKHYGVDFLVSDEFYTLLPTDARELLIAVDCVRMPGCAHPAMLYAGIIDAIGEAPPYTRDWRKLLQAGLDEYLCGNWSKAREYLERCKDRNNKDNISPAILQLMRASNFSSPQDWMGYRILGKKQH